MTQDRYRLAEARLIDAKASYGDACAAALRCDPAAPELVERALSEVREALAELDRASRQTCEISEISES